MFVITRLSLKSSPLRNFISISSVIRLKKPKDLDEIQKAEKLEKSSPKNDINNIQNKKIKKLTEKSGDTLVDFNNINKVQSTQVSLKNTKEYDKKLLDYLEILADNLGGDINKTKSELQESVRTIFEMKGSKLADKKNIKTRSSKQFQISDEILEIVNQKNFKEPENHLKIWGQLQNRELKFLSTIPPRNYFEELAQWTDEGKIWHFPIDNDQGRYEEAAIHFTDHIFLEEHLKDWCPERGPLRHFMELVTVGLSKNYTLTVKDKIEHILWYKDYFEKKKKLLHEVGALSTEVSSILEKD